MPKVMIEMEMPKECWGCRFQGHGTRCWTIWCDVLEKIIEYETGKRNPDCPLQEVKE